MISKLFRPSRQATPQEPLDLRREFWCFISYRHADNREPDRQWATWLQRELEDYRVPPAMVGQENLYGETIPERIFPVFRDEEELNVASDLPGRIQEALENSRFLVVLCSPRAVGSDYVDQEIRYYKQIGRASRVLPVIIDGEPNVRFQDPEDLRECFPLSLAYKVAEDGELLLDQREEPIAADLRCADGQQGWTDPNIFRAELRKKRGLRRLQMEEAIGEHLARFRIAKFKIIAEILGVPLGMLTERDREAEEQRLRQKAMADRRLAVIMSVLFIGACVGGMMAVEMARRARIETARAEALAKSESAARRNEQAALKEAKENARLAEASAKEAREAQARAESMQAEAEKQRDIAVTARNAEAVATREAEDARNEAERQMIAAQTNEKRAVKARASADELIHFMLADLQDSLKPLGHATLLESMNAKAAAYFQENPAESVTEGSLEAKARLASRNGELAFSQGRYTVAEASFQECSGFIREMLVINAADSASLGLLNRSLRLTGDAQLFRGASPSALATYREALEISRKLLALDNTLVSSQSEHATNMERISAALLVGVQKAATPAAAAALEASPAYKEARELSATTLEVRKRLLSQVPEDRWNQCFYTQSMARQAHLHDLLGRPTQALDLYEKCRLQITDVLAARTLPNEMRLDYLRICNSLASWYEANRRLQDALLISKDGNAFGKALMQINPRHVEYKFECANSYLLTGRLCGQLKEPQLAAQQLQFAHSQYREIAAMAGCEKNVQRELAATETMLKQLAR